MGKSRFDKTCVLCGAEYEYCSNCSRFNSLPRWMETLHNENCRIIFNTIMEYKAGVKTPAECAKILNSCDLSYRDRIKPDIDILITAILSEGADVENKSDNLDVSEDTVVKQNIEEAKVQAEPIKVEEKHDDHKTEKKNFNYKKNYKK